MFLIPSSPSPSDLDVVHSVIFDDTPSPPPAKPPRGILRKNAPMKPQRSILRIAPLPNDDKENASSSSNQVAQNSRNQFKAKETMEKMQDYFKRSVEVMRNSGEFTGAEATDILEAYILSHKECFKREDIGRKNAVMLLEIWRKEDFLRAVHPDTKCFEDCDRTYFILSGDKENDNSLFCANSPMSSSKFGEDTISTMNRSVRSTRSNSFKRMFSPLIRRNRSTSRGRDKKDKENTLLKSTWSLFSMADRNEKKAKQAKEQLVKEEEVEIYQLALFHLLSVVEIEFLEDVAAPLHDPKKNASFLTSIMEKMGIGSSEDQLDARQEDEMDLLIETHPLMRSASAWFQMARVCAPMMYLQSTPGKSNVMQLYLWCKAALTAVTDRLEKITNNGSSPLFPNEFSSLLSSIAVQLINDMNSGEKLNNAVMYIVLMVPVPLRETIDNLIQWLQLTLRSDAVEDLRSPYYLGRKEPKHKENCKVIIDEIRPFFFPKNCMTIAQQDIFIETLIELRNEGRLGKLTDAMARSIQARKSSNSESLTPVRYTVLASESLRSNNRKQENDPVNKYEGLTDTAVELVKMIESVLDDKKITLTDKKKHLAAFAKQYPELYKQFFKGML